MENTVHSTVPKPHPRWQPCHVIKDDVAEYMANVGVINLSRKRKAVWMKFFRQGAKLEIE